VALRWLLGLKLRDKVAGCLDAEPEPTPFH
jgi:hypothetical protein